MGTNVPHMAIVPFLGVDMFLGSTTGLKLPARGLWAVAALGVLGWLAPAGAQAQSASIYGSLGNFDVANHTGHDACGYEVEIEGSSAADIGGTFTAQRYGAPRVTATPRGVSIRWESRVNPDTHSCEHRTVAHTPDKPFGGSCYSWSPATYDQAGCEHFGVGLYSAGPPVAHSWWLAPDATGNLVRIGDPVAVAQPYYMVLPGVQEGDPAQVEVEIEAPEPAEAPELYGDAQWMRIFVVQVPREVTLDELMTDNTIVPQDLTQLESDWQIVQDEPASGGNGRRKRHRNAGSIDPTTRTVVRRIELHEFTGAYDPITHEALCADLLCNGPAADEIGQPISAQMSAVLVQPDGLRVTKTGNGNIDSADRLISCGNKCVSPYSAASIVTLTAKAGSGSTFAGWTGACTGTAATCTVSVNGLVNVGASFTQTRNGGGGGGGGGAGGGGGSGNPTLTVKVTNGKGTITGTPGTINCGKACSTSVVAGSAVALTATPEPGFRFVNWGGACTGTAPTCVVTVRSATSVQANFTK